MNLRDQVRDLRGSSKFVGSDLRRTRLLYVLSMEGTDREVGTVDDFGWHGLIGRHVVREDSYGFVDHLTFATVEDATRYLDAMEDEGEDLSGFTSGTGDLRVPDYAIDPHPTGELAEPDGHLMAAYDDAASMGGGDVE